MNAIIRELPVGVTIPATTDELTSTLSGLGALVTAKEWERAAIVWAWTEPGRGGRRRRTDPVPGQFSLRRFSELKVYGLGKLDSIRHYRDAWQWAIDNGYATSVEPGETQVMLPDVEWGTWKPSGDDTPEPPAPKPKRKAKAAPEPEPEPEPLPEPTAAGRYPCRTCKRRYMRNPSEQCQKCETEEFADQFLRDHPGGITIVPDWDKAIKEDMACTGVFHYGRPVVMADVRAMRAKFQELTELSTPLITVERNGLRDLIEEMTQWLDETEPE